MTKWENHHNPEGSRRVDGPNRWCQAIIGWSSRQKMEGVVDSVPPEKGCQVLDEELTC